ncbi:MAG: hypothetical protein A2583_11515 [Bdellovibrionales bacterium RIFOXYD1_FULL_53_11]|nr:MAG: hypothetical protein A2583_11515 [Bdellovibrionales bacterium RIFOXYD1_FULL_53_11]
MEWLQQFLGSDAPAKVIFVVSAAAGTGLLLGNVTIRGLGIGVSGALFAGLALGRMGLAVDTAMLGLIKDFGLVLFVYAVGLQAGPGFFSALRRQGIVLNALALGIITLGTIMALISSGILDIDMPATTGLLAGAVTSTPSIGAAVEALHLLFPSDKVAAETAGMAYAIAYPFGVAGVVLSMHLIKMIFRINPRAESREFEAIEQSATKPLQTRNIEITNSNLDGKTIEELCELCPGRLVITRIMREGAQQLATPGARISAGDIIHAVGTAQDIEKLQLIAGRESSASIPDFPSGITMRKIVITSKQATGMAIDQLGLFDRYAILITRISRAGVEFTPTKGLKLFFGDRLTLVGQSDALKKAAIELGDATRELDKPHVVPVLIGIAAGILIGYLPLSLPWLPVPVRLGLAGGPLIVALAIGRLGRIGPLINYMPSPAKALLRDLGISLFLACIGIASSDRFFAALSTGSGYKLMAAAFAIAFLPPLAAGILVRLRLKMNYAAICGLLAGSTTDSAALAYATELSGSDAPAATYATVYPVTLILRVVVAQVLVFSL